MIAHRPYEEMKVIWHYHGRLQNPVGVFFQRSDFGFDHVGDHLLVESGHTIL